MSRLPKGIFKIPNRPSYYCRIFKDGAERKVALGRNLEAAKKKMHALKSGEPIPVRVTVARAAENWLDRYIRVHRNQKNYRLASVRVAKYLVPFLGAKQIAKVGPDDLRAYRLWLEKWKISTQTVAHVLSDARALFSWAEDTDLIDRSPVRKRLLPRVQEQAPKYLSEGEVAALCSLPDPLGFTCRLGIGLGLRWGELCRARADHIENGMLVVSVRTKSKKLRRVPVPSELLAEIRGRVGLLVPFKESNPGGFMRKVERGSGIKKFHTHRLRHTFATRWISRGGNLAALQIVLGHASIVTTQRYARLSDEMVRVEAQRLEEA